MNETTQLVVASMVFDGAGRCHAPGAILLQNERIVASSSPQDIGAVAEAQKIAFEDHVVTPALVNAHSHLDLTHIGPLPYEGHFADWLGRILAERATTTRQGIRESVLQGVALSRAGGTAFAGDIAGEWSLEPLHAMRLGGLPGVSYLEVFGVGRRQAGSIETMQSMIDSVQHDADGVRLGISPHAPFTCGPELYAAASRLGLPLSTHVAESLDELQFCRDGDGAFAELLKTLNVWDDSITAQNAHPVQLLAETLAANQCVAAHLNYVGDAEIQVLAELGTTVAYCPRSSAYFGHPHNGHPPHRYRDMLEAGVNVALGTDSMVCLDTPERISVLDEMRYLYRRDGGESASLLRMATVNGAVGLGVDPSLVDLSPGPIAGLLALPGRTLADVLVRNDPPLWIMGPMR